ncbi:PIG-L deacetylase family protein [Thalassoroseus pseudoceratinae]|uniref:PIG-L deacetylase family protein n=1 Tax=Thalassoroseus pseudoceratinae TaxID=2713176 RepID=UPI001420650C|nr:PIG-L deacetylase family protein [Thalassoroseus pseudoceratinae]
MIPLQLRNLKTVLCLGAHSDDIEIGCGGTLLKLIAENPGLKVCWVVFSGEQTRVDEATASANDFLEGCHEREVIVKGFRDSYFPYEGEAIKDFFHSLSKVIQPDVVFTHRKEDAHQDHRVLADLTWCTFRNHAILEYEIPKFEGDLGHPNMYVPLEADVCQRKVDLLMHHFATQRSKNWFTRETFDAVHRLRGLECVSNYAEAFTARKLTLN